MISGQLRLAGRVVAGIVSLWFAAVSSARCEVSCPAVFGDHMVLQRGRALPVWGDASPGEHVTVKFSGQEKAAVADSSGHWRTELEPLSASGEARTLTVSGATNTVQFSDVLVGEVWFCSGQSNMEKPLGPRKGQKPTDNYEEELSRARCPTLRLFQMPPSGKTKPGNALMRWWPCDAETLTSTNFSAVAYYFGRELTRELNVPIGLIHSSYGGTRIEAWMPRVAFASDPALRGLENERYDAWVKGVQATELYSTMVAPFVPFALRGFLWYQGEANCMNAEGAIYAAKQRAMVSSWRTAWGDQSAPFYYALLAPFAYSHQKNWAKQLTPEALPALWEAQVAALDVPHSGIITTTDLAGSGRDIHPTNKRDVGLRFARIALADTYGRRDLAEVAFAPQFVSMTRRVGGVEDRGGKRGEGGATEKSGASRIELTFAHAAGLHARDGAPLTDFAIAGEDRKFHPAEAQIVGENVIVWSEEVAAPVAVRFAWNELANPNLVNGGGSPALPFRTDDWPVKRVKTKAEVTTKNLE